MEQEDDNAAFDEVVELDVFDKERECRFQHCQKAKDDPVRHPLGSISVDNLSPLQGLERHVCRVDEAEQVRKQFDSTNRKDKSEKNKNSAKEKESLGLAGLCLQLLQFLCK